MSPYSRAQRVRVFVESRLAMKEVPSQGRPRGPGGRGGIGFVADGIAVADMSRELLGHESVLAHDTPAAPRIFRGVVRREVRWAGHFSRNGTWRQGVPPPVAIERVRKSLKTRGIEGRRRAKESVTS